jgi:outer membrane protein OmpU
MKKVLLATSALFLTAGVASAEITMSGTAQAAMVATGAANAVVVTGADLNFGLSATADNGATFSTTIDMGNGQTVDYNDDFALDTQDRGDAAPTITIGYAGYTITAANEAVDDLYDDADANHKDIGISGAVGGNTFAVAIDTDDNKMSAKLGVALAGATITYATSNESGENGGNSLAISYPMGDLTLSASTNDNGTAKTTNKVGVSYKMDALTIGYTIENALEAGWSNYDLSVAYSAGALGASFATDEAGVNKVVGTYDMGGGAKLYASSKSTKGTNNQQAVGVSFAF